MRDDAKNTDTYAAGGVPARELIEDALNLKASIAYDEIHDPETRKTKRIKNHERTAAAQDAQQKLKDAFFQWARKSDLVPEIEAEYNQVRNAYRQRQWEAADFRHFPNAATTVELHSHQKTSVARNMIESNLMAHPVGSGKTYVYATTAMEWKRLGLARKPVIAVLKSTLGQVEEAFRRLYPQAKILVPHEKDFARESRQKMLARIATGDYDAIILTHENLNGISDDPERERQYIRERVAGLVDAICRVVNDQGGDAPTVKQLRKSKDALEKRLHELQNRKTDNNLTFEQLGIDGLIVDEAHMYKKLEFETQMDHIKGLDKGASQRSSSLMMKARFIQEKTGGRNLVLGIRRHIERLTEKRDERRDGFAKVMGKAFKLQLGDKADDVAKVLAKHGIPRDLGTKALKLADEAGAFTVFAVLDALTRIAGGYQYVGDHTEIDQRASSLLALAAEGV